MNLEPWERMFFGTMAFAFVCVGIALLALTVGMVGDMAGWWVMST